MFHVSSFPRKLSVSGFSPPEGTVRYERGCRFGLRVFSYFCIVAILTCFCVEFLNNFRPIYLGKDRKKF